MVVWHNVSFFAVYKSNSPLLFLGSLICIGKFTYSYKRALCCCLLFYVCQSFEQSADDMSEERRNTFKDFSSFLLVGRLCKMSCAASSCSRRWFCVEFCTAHVISFVKLPTKRNRKEFECFSSTEHITADGRSS